jgi:proteasome lid subunit RPN8/RPN11
MVTKPDGRGTAVAPDAASVKPGEYPERALPPLHGPRQAGFQVVARRSALNDIYRHGHANPGHEVCGVLVGNVYRDEAGPFLYVEASVRGEHAGSQGAQVTFTPETWAYLQEQMDKHHAGRRMVGWYHTHPGFGIFLSGMDLFIQENFFSLPWQVAFVYDPVSGEEGLFVWREGAPRREAILVEEDAMSEKRLEAVGGRGGAEAPGAAERLDALRRQQTWLLAGVGAVALLVLVWPVLYGGLARPASGDGHSDEWSQHFLAELAQLRAESKQLRAEVAGLREGVWRLRDWAERFPPPADQPDERVLSLIAAGRSALAVDLMPGPPRLLITGVCEEALSRARVWAR